MDRPLRTVAFVACAILLASGTGAARDQETGSTDAPRTTRMDTRFEIRVTVEDGCPIEILERKTRVLDALDRHPYERITGQKETDKRTYGLGESQFVYEIGYRNHYSATLREVTFLWSAFDADGKRLFFTKTRHDRPVPRGTAFRDHFSNYKMGGDIARFEVRVEQATFEDGHVWRPKRDADD